MLCFPPYFQKSLITWESTCRATSLLKATYLLKPHLWNKLGVLVGCCARIFGHDISSVHEFGCLLQFHWPSALLLSFKDLDIFVVWFWVYFACKQVRVSFDCLPILWLIGNLQTTLMLKDGWVWNGIFFDFDLTTIWLSCLLIHNIIRHLTLVPWTLII